MDCSLVGLGEYGNSALVKTVHAQRHHGCAMAHLFLDQRAPFAGK
jgi:hypothetical protein